MWTIQGIDDIRTAIRGLVEAETKQETAIQTIEKQLATIGEVQKMVFELQSEYFAKKFTEQIKERLAEQERALNSVKNG